MTISYDQADFLCVGCFGWARANTAREAFKICKANASPSMVKAEHRIFRIWRIADQIDQISVSGIDGSWSATPVEGVTLDKDVKPWYLVWQATDKTKIAIVPELPSGEWLN